MTLKQLCNYFKSNQNDINKCEYYKNEYLMLTKDSYAYEELDESDIFGLRPYLMCFSLALYEYLSNFNYKELPDWLSRYDVVICDRHDNDYYKTLVDGCNFFGEDGDSVADDIFFSMLDRAIPEFKKRNLPLCKLYDSV